MKNDYRVYKLNRKEMLQAVVEGLLLDAVIAILFYNNPWAMIPGILFVLFYVKEKKHCLKRKRRIQMQKDLQEFLNALIAALQTGRSMENAFVEALKDIRAYVGKDTIFVLEMKQICKSIQLGEPLEKLLKEFSNRSGLEELEYFAEVFEVGKRSGGNIIGIMKNTIRMLQEKMDAEAEIYTVLAEKRLEIF